MRVIDYIPRVYLIDTENIGKRLIKELSNIRDIDNIIIFESDKTFKLSFSDLTNISMSNISVINTHNGAKNAMDFMITTVVGHLVTENKDRIYIIVSDDSGFDEVVNYWKFQGIYIRRHNGIGIEDRSLDVQIHRGKEVQLKELNKVYDKKHKNDCSSIQNNIDILNNYINIRSNESVNALAGIIYSFRSFEDCKDSLELNLRYNKASKLKDIELHWNEFFHVS